MTSRSLNLRRAGKLALALAALFILGPYAWGPVYEFPDPAPFAGAEFYNPYAAVPDRWQRANFHAHGRAWRGLTNGRQSDAEVVARYRELGYDVPGVSNYQRIAARHGVATIPVYEHGYNIVKQHQLAIGAHEVEWFDFLLWQTRSHQQFVIDRVKRKTDLVALAHPSARDAYTVDDLQSLTSYDLIEVVNGPFTTADVWDAALSSGHAVWAVADDDTHDLEDPRRTAAGWNMVGAPTADTKDIVSALAAGRSYAVLRTGALESAHVTQLDAVDVRGGSMRVSLRGAPSTITFVGQNGAIRKSVKNTLAADYAWTDSDTYVRTVVETPQTVLFVNPVLRYDGGALPRPVSHVDTASTWIVRGSIALGLSAIAFALTRRRHVSPAVAPEPLLANAKRKTA